VIIVPLKKKITWLPDIPDLIPATLFDYGYLITKEKLEEGDKVEENMNENLAIQTLALGDPNLRLLEKGQKLQLERTGYFICDVPYLGPGSRLILIEIPDGRVKDVYKRGDIKKEI